MFIRVTRAFGASHPGVGSDWLLSAWQQVYLLNRDGVPTQSRRCTYSIETTRLPNRDGVPTQSPSPTVGRLTWLREAPCPPPRGVPLSQLTRTPA